MKELQLSHLYLEVDGHNLYGLDDDTILDAIELAKEGREFTNQSGFLNRYLHIMVDGELLGAGVQIVEDTLVVRTILTEKQVMENEQRSLHRNDWVAFRAI